MTRKNFLITITLGIILLCFITSCNKKPNPFVQEKKDITMVYGLINPVDTIHYIRIQKAFLTEGNAFEMATDAESNLYIDSLTVRVYVTDQYGAMVPSMNWILEKTFVNKDTVGDFTWSEQLPVFYFTKTFNHEQISDKIFKLEITNNVTGKQIFGNTYIVNDYHVVQPSSINNINPQFTMLWEAKESVIEFNQALYGQRYEVYTYFIYDEYQLSDDSKKTYALKWNFGSYVHDGSVYELPSKPEKFHIYYNPSSFYPWLKNKIPANENVARVPRYFKFYFWSCTPEMNTYMEVNNVNTGIVQDRPEYTNLTSNTGTNDVYGIFTCRYSKIYNNIQVAPLMSVYLRDSLNLSFRTTYP